MVCHRRLVSERALRLQWRMNFLHQSHACKDRLLGAAHFAIAVVEGPKTFQYPGWMAIHLHASNSSMFLSGMLPGGTTHICMDSRRVCNTVCLDMALDRAGCRDPKLSQASPNSTYIPAHRGER